MSDRDSVYWWMTQITQIIDQRMRQPVLEIVLAVREMMRNTHCHWSKSTNITSLWNTAAREKKTLCDKNACAIHAEIRLILDKYQTNAVLCVLHCVDAVGCRVVRSIVNQPYKGKADFYEFRGWIWYFSEESIHQNILYDLNGVNLRSEQLKSYCTISEPNKFIQIILIWVLFVFQCLCS